jgi:pimeloyl-ACP methyl ester carboxylesterase
LDVALKLSFVRRAALFVTVLAMIPLLRAQDPKPLLVAPGVLPPTKTALVFGQKIVYYEAGTGPTVVLVHGFGSSAMFDFGNVIMPLAKTHHVIALDQIGWGASDKPYIDYRIQTFVDFLGEFLRVKNVERFDLVGESLGGWIAAAYTIQALDPANTGKYALPKPSKLVLEDAAGHKAIHSDGPIPLSAAVADAAGVGVILYDKSRVTPEFVRQNFAVKLKANDGTTQRLLRANPKLESETVGDKLARITIPTLVVWGGNDAVVPLADGKDYAAKIPNAKLVIVPECGHVSSMEKPGDFLAAVVPFLK